jgi:hypothetical protein
MAHGELRQTVGQADATKISRSTDSENSTRLLMKPTDCHLGILEVVKHALHPIAKRNADLRQRHTPGRAVQEPNAKALF